MSATKGFSAIRNGYLISAGMGRMPLAFAVIVYCFCSSSSRFGAHAPAHRGRARKPDHHQGAIRCEPMEPSLACSWARRP